MSLRRSFVLALLGTCAVLAASCAGKHVVLGDQCPSPYSGHASLPVGTDAGDKSTLYGTSCAPCDKNAIHYDKRGCPIYVTFESCGGNICLGSDELPRPGLDEDGGESTPSDASMATEEDGGAH